MLFVNVKGLLEFEKIKVVSFVGIKKVFYVELRNWDFELNFLVVNIVIVIDQVMMVWEVVYIDRLFDVLEGL